MARESSREELTLLDVVCAIQDEARDDREALATLIHLLTASASHPEGSANRVARRMSA